MPPREFVGKAAKHKVNPARSIGPGGRLAPCAPECDLHLNRRGEIWCPQHGNVYLGVDA